MKAVHKNLLKILAFSLLPTFLIWLPFFLRVKSFWSIPLPSENGMATIVSNYDGPLFLAVAKSFYNREILGTFSLSLPTEYYAAHFPLFPALIRIFSVVLGYPYAMLFVTLGSSFLALYFFFKLAKRYVTEEEALFLTFVFSIIPARWLIVRSVGSAEPLFIAAIIASVYHFSKKNYLGAGIWGLLAQLTKSPGILLFAAYFAYLVLPNLKKITLPKLKIVSPLLLIPFSLLLVFGLFKISYGDFLAYFHSGDNIHLFFPPFQIFNYSAPWVGTFWLEEVIFVYLFGILGLLKLIAQKRFGLAWVYGVFFASTLFVSHRDLIRYSLPLVPFLLIAFSETLLKKEFRIALGLIAIPIYLFALSFISQNAMPIGNWAPFL